MSDFGPIVDFFREVYPLPGLIALHEPRFRGNEKKYINEAIDSTFVSSVGAYVDKFESLMAMKSGTQRAVAVVNGTAAIQVALRIIGIKPGDEVITQALTFIATANAIVYNGALPVFLDIDKNTMGLSPQAVGEFLDKYGEIREDGCYNKSTGNKIAACLPMHTFGFPVDLDGLLKVCTKWNIPLVEDAAGSLGSEYKGRPTGSFGIVSAFSFNGNKIATTGGGGVIVSNNNDLGSMAKHLTTTAKIPHKYEYVHDQLGYNFRMPNLNAALGCAQLEQLDTFLADKRQLAAKYDSFFRSKGIKFRKELPDTRANYWLMCVELENKTERDLFLETTNNQQVMTRPIWQLMFRSPMYSHCQRDEQINAMYLEERIVNIPSSVR